MERQNKRRRLDAEHESAPTGGTCLAEGQQDVSGLQISGYMLPKPIKVSRSLIDADRPTRGWQQCGQICLSPHRHPLPAARCPPKTPRSFGQKAAGNVDEVLRFSPAGSSTRDTTNSFGRSDPIVCS